MTKEELKAEKLLALREIRTQAASSLRRADGPYRRLELVGLIESMDEQIARTEEKE